MVEVYKEVEVTCPVCELVKSLKIPEVVFTQKKFGTIKVQVPQGGVCNEHQFIVFIDTKGIIRGYEKIDLLMRVTQPQREIDSRDLTLNDIIQMFGIYGVFSLIHAKVFNYSAYVILGKFDSYDATAINILFENLIPEKYQGANWIEFIENTAYDKIKFKDKESLLIDSYKNIMQSPWDEKLKMKFEQSILKKALDIINEKEQLILLQRDIAKLISEAEYVIRELENVKELYDDVLIEKMSRELMISKINQYRLSLIKEFISRRYSSKLVSRLKNKVEEFLDIL